MTPVNWGLLYTL